MTRVVTSIGAATLGKDVVAERPAATGTRRVQLPLLSMMKTINDPQDLERSHECTAPGSDGSRVWRAKFGLDFGIASRGPVEPGPWIFGP